MNAVELLETLDRMKRDNTLSSGFAKANYDIYIINEDYDGAARVIEQWARLHPKDEHTVLIPDEITLVTTLEVTTVLDKEWLDMMADGHEMDATFVAEYKRQLDNWIRNRWFGSRGADDVNILDIQQFVTKGHEEAQDGE